MSNYDPRDEGQRPTLRYVAPGEEARRVLVDVFGPSNSGKTWSALLIATGLVAELGGRIAMIDTEGRGNLYDGEFDFDRYVMEPPFTPAAFMAAYEQLDSKYSVVITDTISDEYEGIGGLQEMAEAQPVNNDVAKWAKPKAAHRKLMARVRQLKAQHIFCVRAEDKIEIYEGEENGRKKKLVRPLGWVRVAEKKWKYDMTVSLYFPPACAGKAEVDKMIGPLEGAFKSGALVTEEYGRALGRWAKNAPTATPIKTTPTRTLALYAADGTEAGQYETGPEWLTGLEMVAKGDAAVGLITANWELLTKIATNAKASQDLRARAEKLRALAPSQEAA